MTNEPTIPDLNWGMIALEYTRGGPSRALTELQRQGHTITPVSTVEPSDALVERVARAICTARGLDPNTLFQHFDHEAWPEDSHFINSRRERCPMHYGWRKHVDMAKAAIAAMGT